MVVLKYVIGYISFYRHMYKWNRQDKNLEACQIICFIYHYKYNMIRTKARKYGPNRCKRHFFDLQFTPTLSMYSGSGRILIFSDPLIPQWHLNQTNWFCFLFLDWFNLKYQVQSNCPSKAGISYIISPFVQITHHLAQNWHVMIFNKFC